MPFRVLVAEDEEITLKHLVYTLKKEGYETEGAADGLEARRMNAERPFDVVIADIRMPGMDGMRLLSEIKENTPETEVIIVTGYGAIGSAIEAIRKGAYDYVTKPFELDDLLQKVAKIRERKSLRRENIALRAFLGMHKKVNFIAKSARMRKVLEIIEGMSESDCNVLLTGETGVGKSLLAKIIHLTTRRRDLPFLALNCATLTEELLASELFGHERGAFTGAVRMKQGLVEIADTGTLFLDEISELSTNLQAKMLKVIEEGEFYRVGGTRPIHVDVRFIAATNRNVQLMISEGKFREDLYYRLNVMEIFIPPLRDRKEDIAPLAEYFLEKHLPKAGKKIGGFAPGTIDILEKYSFPGNVRELENIVERAIILEKSASITPSSLPDTMRMFKIETIEPAGIRTLDDVGKEYAGRVLELAGGNRSKAAELLGISRTSLWRILKGE
ncbi:MAG: sigma-54-dependent Fis family transcriptional regulator [Nitrospirae bacterium]|nr:sigma-54-dependent Fis family transcriptional regulator [Nitrospirota bacterium]